MTKFFSAAAALLSVVFCGFFSIALGLCIMNLASRVGDAFLSLGFGLLVSFPMALIFVGRAVGARMKVVMAPLSIFFSLCFLAGVAFESIEYPFGFKLIGLALLLLLVGLALGRRSPFVRYDSGETAKLGNKSDEDNRAS